MKRFEDLPLLGGARPILGHMRALVDDQIGFFQRVAREVDRMARLRTVGAQTVVINHPEVVRELFVEKSKVYEKTELTRFVLYGLAGEGLVSSTGDLWKRQRKLLSPIFHSSHIAGFASDMVALTVRGVRPWKDGETISVTREMSRIMMTIAGKTLFGLDTLSGTDELGAAIDAGFDWMRENLPSTTVLAHLLARRILRNVNTVVKSERLGRAADKLQFPVFLPGASGKKFRAAVAQIDVHVERMIAARRADPTKTDDVLALLLRAKDEDGAKMSDRQVRDEIVTLFTAGHETIATALSWTLYLLARHERIYAALEREVDALGADPTLADLASLPLAQRVFKEALRLYPSVHILGRQSEVASSIDGYALGWNAIAIVSPYALHRRADLWPDPERFDPDRFLPEAEAARPRFAWMPFGAGPRICVGAGFSMIEGPLVLATIVRRAHFESLAEEVPEPDVILHPRGPMPMRVRLRAHLETRSSVPSRFVQ